MKNTLSAIVLTLLFSIFFTPAAFADDNQFFGIGAELFQDPFNKKVIITNVFPDSPVQKSGITAGSEIVSVDGQKVKKLALCETISKIRGEEGAVVKLVIRNGWRWKTYELKRALITPPQECVNTCIESHWGQIAPAEYTFAKPFAKEISNKLSRKYRKTILPVINYWHSRKGAFKIGYNTCMTYTKENQEVCLINLLNRENQKTVEDKKIYKLLQTDVK